jgi:uncharacterized membrane protein YhhN
MCTVIFNLAWLHHTVKPLFMIMLMVYVHRQVEGKYNFFYKAIQFGLFFSWIGDIALMFDEQIPILFVVGLAAFLIAHLGYSLGFIKNIKASAVAMPMGKAVATAIPFVVFTGCFFFYMKDGLPAELFIPVLAYTVVISVMGITAALRHGHVEQKTYRWILWGAILFILSDCVIAINKFVIDFEYDAILNMALYLSGQYLIALGAIYFSEQRKSF